MTQLVPTGTLTEAVAAAMVPTKAVAVPFLLALRLFGQLPAVVAFPVQPWLAPSHASFSSSSPDLSVCLSIALLYLYLAGSLVFVPAPAGDGRGEVGCNE